MIPYAGCNFESVFSGLDLGGVAGGGVVYVHVIPRLSKDLRD